MKIFQSLRSAVIGLLIITPALLKAQVFCDHSPATRFFESEIHVMVGGSSITQNYMSCFSEIRELNASMGTAWGAGVKAELGLRNFLSIGTQINLIVNNNKTDLAISNDNATSLSNVFLENRYYYINIPVYMSFRFNLASSIRWNVDGGIYYSYGIGGSQKQTAYTSTVNPLGQLINRITVSKPGYFNNEETFINSFRRSDIGLHIATGLTFNYTYTVGVRSMIGFKNISTVGESGISNPNIHNINLMLVLGYKF